MNDLSRIVKALERIADAHERIARSVETQGLTAEMLETIPDECCQKCYFRQETGNARTCNNSDSIYFRKHIERNQRCSEFEPE